MDKIGDFYRDIGRKEDAIGVYKKATEVNVLNPMMWNGLGNVYRDSGLLDKSIECYQKAIKILPTEIARDNLGNVYIELRNYEKAVAIYSEMIRANQESIAYVSLATCLLKMDMKREAEINLEIAQSLLDNTPIYVRARIQSVSNDIEGALISLQNALKSKSVSKAWIQRDSNFDFIRDDPRFKELIND